MVFVQGFIPVYGNCTGVHSSVDSLSEKASVASSGSKSSEVSSEVSQSTVCSSTEMDLTSLTGGRYFRRETSLSRTTFVFLLWTHS